MGVGLVRVLICGENIVLLLMVCLELIVYEFMFQLLEESLIWVDVVVIGLGFGQQEWGKKVLQKVENVCKFMLWDVDVLNLLVINFDKCYNCVIMLYLGEVVCLLGCFVVEIESDCLFLVQCLVKWYGGVVVLKGVGMIIVVEYYFLVIIDVGNVGMVSGGMGDVLFGIIGVLFGQKFILYDVVCVGCVVYGVVVDLLVVCYGVCGMLVIDFFIMLWCIVNFDVIDVNYDELSNFVI